MPTETANEQAFVVADHPDLPSLKRAYSRAYAVSLREQYKFQVVGDVTAEQQTIITAVETGRAKDQKRGERSVIPGVKVRGESCRLKRHFTGCMRQVIGYAELQAAKDPERFVWIKAWQKTAKRGCQGEDGSYSQTTIRRCTWAFEACGIFTPAQRRRGGAVRTGWIIANHDDVALRTGGRCCLTAVPKYTISPRVQGQKLERYLDRGTYRGTLNEAPSNLPRNLPRNFEGLARGTFNSL